MRSAVAQQFAEADLAGRPLRQVFPPIPGRRFCFNATDHRDRRRGRTDGQPSSDGRGEARRAARKPKVKAES